MDIPNYDKNQILQQFNQLLAERKTAEAPIAVKQKQLQLEADQRTLEMASTHTVESIVKGLADLQLDFKSRVDDISGKLSAEVSKLVELKRAIQVAKQHLDELQKIRIAAEALNILIQENEQKSAIFENEAGQKRQNLESEIVTTKADWKKEQEEFEAANKERQERLKKERKKNEADYKYEVERKRKIELDKHEEKKRILERKLVEESEKYESDWAEREKILAGQKAELEKYQAMVVTSEKELEDAVQKAQAEAIKEAQEKAALAADLFEKEVTANREVYELNIKSLEESVATQAKQIEDLNAQLQAAVKQSQELAFKTVGSVEKIVKSTGKEKVV
jgi:hypothetical protein